MPPVNLDVLLGDVADRVATVAAYADRVAVGRGPGWALADGPYAVVDQGRPVVPAATGDGATLVESLAVSVAVWQADTGVSSTVVADTVAALDGWAPPGKAVAGRVFGTYRVPQPETDVVRTEIEVRYAHHR